MAAVIRYLSADNHMADTPMNNPETGLRRPAESLFPAPVFELSVCQCPVLYAQYMYPCVCVFTDITYRVCVQRNIAAALFFLIYIYIGSTSTVWTIKKTLFHANRAEILSIFICHAGSFIGNLTTARKAVCRKKIYTIRK